MGTRVGGITAGKVLSVAGAGTARFPQPLKRAVAPVNSAYPAQQMRAGVVRGGELTGSRR